MPLYLEELKIAYRLPDSSQNVENSSRPLLIPERIARRSDTKRDKRNPSAPKGKDTRNYYSAVKEVGLHVRMHNEANTSNPKCQYRWYDLDLTDEEVSETLMRIIHDKAEAEIHDLYGEKTYHDAHRTHGQRIEILVHELALDPMFDPLSQTQRLFGIRKMLMNKMRSKRRYQMRKDRTRNEKGKKKVSQAHDGSENHSDFRGTDEIQDRLCDKEGSDKGETGLENRHGCEPWADTEQKMPDIDVDQLAPLAHTDNLGINARHDVNTETEEIEPDTISKFKSWVPWNGANIEEEEASSVVKDLPGGFEGISQQGSTSSSSDLRVNSVKQPGLPPREKNGFRVMTVGRETLPSAPPNHGCIGNLSRSPIRCTQNSAISTPATARVRSNPLSLPGKKTKVNATQKLVSKGKKNDNCLTTLRSKAKMRVGTGYKPSRRISKQRAASKPELTDRRRKKELVKNRMMRAIEKDSESEYSSGEVDAQIEKLKALKKSRSVVKQKDFGKKRGTNESSKSGKRRRPNPSTYSVNLANEGRAESEEI